MSPLYSGCLKPPSPSKQPAQSPGRPPAAQTHSSCHLKGTHQKAFFQRNPSRRPRLKQQRQKLLQLARGLRRLSGGLRLTAVFPGEPISSASRTGFYQGQLCVQLRQGFEAWPNTAQTNYLRIEALLCSSARCSTPGQCWRAPGAGLQMQTE